MGGEKLVIYLRPRPSDDQFFASYIVSFKLCLGRFICGSSNNESAPLYYFEFIEPGFTCTASSSKRPWLLLRSYKVWSRSTVGFPRYLGKYLSRDRRGTGGTGHV